MPKQTWKQRCYDEVNALAVYSGHDYRLKMTPKRIFLNYMCDDQRFITILDTPNWTIMYFSLVSYQKGLLCTDVGKRLEAAS